MSEFDPSPLIESLRPGGIIPALLVLALAYAASRVTAQLLNRVAERRTEWRLALQQVKAIVRLMIALSAIALAVALVLHLSPQALLAIGGTLAVAVGISLRDLVSSIIAGITILIDRPFQVGDRITYGDVYGEVTEIGLRTVRVVTLDDNIVTIPNNRFLSDVVSSGNAGALDMLVQMDFFIGLDQDLKTAKAIVAEALASSRFTFLNKPWSIVVSSITQGDTFAIRLRAKVYVLDVKYEKALETDVTERVLLAFQEEGIAPPTIGVRAGGPLTAVA